MMRDYQNGLRNGGLTVGTIHILERSNGKKKSREKHENAYSLYRFLASVRPTQQKPTFHQLKS